MDDIYVMVVEGKPVSILPDLKEDHSRYIAPADIGLDGECKNVEVVMYKKQNVFREYIGRAIEYSDKWKIELVIDERMIEKAEEYAREKHKNQVRKFSGEPYINHPIRVSKIVKEFNKSREMVIAAILHDTVEDTDTTIEYIELHFGREVSKLVNELTSDKEEISRMGKTKYLTMKMSKMTDDALLIKLADRFDNISDVSSKEFKEKYYIETAKIMTGIVGMGRVLLREHIEMIGRINSVIY